MTKSDLGRAGAAGDKETVACNACGTPAQGDRAFVVQGFTVVRCPKCRVLRVSPRFTAEALAAYYDKAYWTSTDSVERGYFDYVGDQNNIIKTFERRIKWMAPYLPGQVRLLDVGCASGFLIQTCLARGWDAAGVEWSEYAVSQAAEKVKPRITKGTLQDLSHSPESLDVVTFWDYLEHSPVPRDDCQKAASLLKKGGWLSIIIPDAGSWLAKWMGPRWEEYKKPQEHLYFFAGKQLRQMLQSLGFSVVQTKYEGKYASLNFALTRFQPGDGLFYALARPGLKLLKLLGLDDAVVYINPFDKLHLLCRKEHA